MSKTKAILITFFLGGLGVHRFMAGKTGTGIIWLLSGGCLGIGWLIDFIKVCTGKFKEVHPVMYILCIPLILYFIV